MQLIDQRFNFALDVSDSRGVIQAQVSGPLVNQPVKPARSRGSVVVEALPAAHHLVRVHALGQHCHVDVDLALKSQLARNGDELLSCLLAAGIAVEAENKILNAASQSLNDLHVGSASALHGNDVLDSMLPQRDHVQVALDKNQRVGLSCSLLGSCLIEY